MKTIMLIDDEDLVVKSVEKLLRKEGYDVITYRNGKDAIENIDKHDVHLIICDIRMPGLSGVETIKRIREIQKNDKEKQVPEILITGYADQNANAEAEELKVSNYLYKPFDLRVLLAAIKKSLGEAN